MCLFCVSAGKQSRCCLFGDGLFTVTQREETGNESSVPPAPLWKRLKCLPLVAACGRSTFQPFQGRTPERRVKTPKSVKGKTELNIMFPKVL